MTKHQTSSTNENHTIHFKFGFRVVFTFACVKDLIKRFIRNSAAYTRDCIIDQLYSLIL